MRKLYIAILAICATLSLASAKQNRKNIIQKNSIRIVVQIDSNVQIPDLSLIYYENSWLIGDQLRAAKDKSNTESYRFTFSPKKNERIVYFSLDQPFGKDGYVNFISNFIASPGDDIKIKVVKGTTILNRFALEFEGKGSAKYQCQYEFYDMLIKTAKHYKKELIYTLKNSETIKDSVYYQNFLSQFRYNLKVQTEVYKQNLVILEKYKGKLGDFMYNLLKAQVYGNLEDANITNLTYPYTFFKDRTLLPANIKSIEDSLKSAYHDRFKANFKEIREDYLALSGSYINYMIKKTADTIIDKENHYSEIKAIYSGVLRDRILAAYFSRYFFRAKDADRNVRDALTFVKTDYCRQILLSFNNNLSPGKPSYNFKFPDTSGRVVRLEDFKGKVIVMDFWFSGCSGCRSLTEKMAPVVKRFEGNNKIVFVSVSIDKDISTWKSSVRTGKYSHIGSVDLLANRKTEDNIINHYKLFSYPTLILIDKDGKVISGNPPRPYNATLEKSLINLLNKAIAN
jgi:thiol-disulfide isomerase/thioredoxin